MIQLWFVYVYPSTESHGPSCPVDEYLSLTTPEVPTGRRILESIRPLEKSKNSTGFVLNPPELYYGLDVFVTENGKPFNVTHWTRVFEEGFCPNT